MQEQAWALPPGPACRTGNPEGRASPSARVVLPLVVTGLLVYESNVRARELELASAIRDAGGRIDLRPPLRERMHSLIHRQRVHGTTVFLGQGIDDAWIGRHDALRGLRIDSLTIGNVALTGAALARLLSVQAVRTLRASGENLTDDSNSALADNGNLEELSLAYTTLNDAQFSRLPLEQLERLDISGTRVTVAGLAELRRCDELRRLGIDANQLTDETVRTVNELSTLEELALCGPDVTDDDLSLLHELKSLKKIRLWATFVTESGKESLGKALPGCRLVRDWD